MSLNNPGRKIYKSMNGVPVELDKLILRNETTLAVGNIRVNARGDTIGPGGIIIKKHDDAVAENAPTSDNVVSQPVRPKKVLSGDDVQSDEVEKSSPKPKSIRSTKQPEE